MWRQAMHLYYGVANAGYLNDMALNVVNIDPPLASGICLVRDPEHA